MRLLHAHAPGPGIRVTGRPAIIATALLCLAQSPPALAQTDDGADSILLDDGRGTQRQTDEPAADPRGRQRSGDEPALTRSLDIAPATSGWGRFWVQLDLAFGWASLLADPDVGEGYGGGAFLSAGFHRRFGAELSVYFANNPYSEELGAIGTTFMSGNISLGPVVHLLDPDGRFLLALEAGIGFYVIVPPPILQDEAWTFGMYGGGTFGLRITRWLEVGVKLRYHVFNLATVSGDDLRDIKAFKEMGAVDRLELPVFVGVRY